MGDKDLTIKTEISPVVEEIKNILDTARGNVARQVNSELLNAYWNIGRIICEYEQNNPERDAVKMFRSAVDLMFDIYLF